MEAAMEQFVGLDVSLQLTHVCVVNREGDVIWRGTCHSSPEEIATTIRARAPYVVRIGLETGQLSTWHWHALKKMGLPIVCLDARHAKAALSMQINKTDRNDAFGLAQIIRTGWYREVGVKSLDNHKIRAVLGSRAQLVGMQTDIRNQIRGLLKVFGVVLQRGHNKSFEANVAEFAEGDGILETSLKALLAVLKIVHEQVEQLDRMAIGQARQHPMCRHLMSIPGVGALTSLAFVSTVEDPGRFRKSRSVGAYFGLTPKRYQSGETDTNGRISKWGDALVRAYLYEAATSLLARSKKWSALKAWGIRLAKRVGMKKARVAVARKLAVIMHQMWTTGEEFRWSNTGSNMKVSA
jgi:transposase